MTVHFRVPEVNAVSKDQQGNQDLRVPLELLESLVSEVLKVLKAQWVLKVHKVLVVPLVQWERLVRSVL